MTELEARSRWSYVARCPKMGALALLGSEPKEAPEDVQRLWRRGKDCEAFYGERLEAKYDGGVLRQKTVPWPGGIGHPDFFVIPESLTVEVKSRVTLEADDADLLQLAGYMHFDEESKRGALVLIDPASYAERVLPVTLTPELREQVESVTADVLRAGKGGALPDCVCSTPDECRFGKFCPFTDEAWADWTPPEPVKLSEPALAELAAELWRAEQALTGAKTSADAFKGERDEIRERARSLGLEPGTDYEAGGIRFRYVVSDPRVTYDVRTALKAGALDADTLEPFRKVGKASERWTVRALDPAMSGKVAPDYGEDPPF